MIGLGCECVIWLKFDWWVGLLGYFMIQLYFEGMVYSSECIVLRDFFGFVMCL